MHCQKSPKWATLFTSLWQNFQTLLSSLHLVTYFFFFLALELLFLNFSFSFFITLLQLKYHHFCIVCYTLVFKGFAYKTVRWVQSKYTICEETTSHCTAAGDQHPWTNQAEPLCLTELYYYWRILCKALPVSHVFSRNSEIRIKLAS